MQRSADWAGSGRPRRIRCGYRKSFRQDVLRARRASQGPSTNASEISPHDFTSHVHFLGLSKAQNLRSLQRRIVFAVRNHRA